MSRLRFLAHNLVVHPVCGALWFFNFDSIADRLHDWSGRTMSNEIDRAELVAIAKQASEVLSRALRRIPSRSLGDPTAESIQIALHLLGRITLRPPPRDDGTGAADYLRRGGAR